jgi:gamma-aminobutyric acid type B receptor
MFLIYLFILPHVTFTLAEPPGDPQECSLPVNGPLCILQSSRNAADYHDRDGVSAAATVCESCFNATQINSNKPPIYILVMAPYPDCAPFNPSLEFGPSVVPAAFVARDLINQRDDILKDFRIELVVYDSGCNLSSKAVNNFLEALFHSNKRIVGIIGPACSEATIAIANIITDNRMSLIQIAPSATSPKLANTTAFPNTFRPIISAQGFVYFYMDLIEHMKYKKVGVIYEALRSFHTAVYSKFEEVADLKNITLASFGLFNTHFPLDEFRQKIRVIFVFASLKFARNLLCTAYHEHMLYGDYQFIFTNRKRANFLTNVSFELDHEVTNCTQEQMEKATVGMIFNDFRLTREDRDDNETDARISYNDFSKRYTALRSCHVQSLGLSKVVETSHHSGYFDSTWALALSLNNSLEAMGLTLSDYMYEMPPITQIVREELLNLTFEGMRGRVEFSDATHDGTDVTFFDMYQTFSADADTSIVGYHNANGLTLLPNASILQAEFDLDYLRPSTALGVIVMIAVAILTVVLVICHIANIVWGNYKTVKADSPNLNHLIFSGCYLSLIGAIVYTNAFVFIEPDISGSSNILIPVHCSALQWTITMTFSLVFGTLAVKTWRIYRIFHSFTTTPMKILTDRVLIIIALSPLAIDVIVNVLWNFLDPWYLHIERGRDLFAEITCNTRHEKVWYPSIAAPKCILTLVVLYLAIATRRVHRKEFKQTKSINVLIFCLLILSGIFLPLFFILQTSVSPWTIPLAYFSFCLFDLALVVLCIVFVFLPPLRPVIKEKIKKRQVIRRPVISR